MLKALLALLLLRADASSYGFPYGFSVAWNSDSSLVHHARGYAANVVNISMNDLTTMRNTEVLCPSMDNLSTHTHDGNRALLTTPLHASQLEEVHPRGPAVLTNMPDNNTNTTGQNPLSTTDDQPPRLDHDTSHYTNTNANAICVVTTFYSKSNDTGDGYNEDHNTEPPPSAIRAVLDAVINEYQYYVHKPPHLTHGLAAASAMNCASPNSQVGQGLVRNGAVSALRARPTATRRSTTTTPPSRRTQPANARPLQSSCTASC
jgi:hypothetical protein